MPETGTSSAKHILVKYACKQSVMNCTLINSL